MPKLYYRDAEGGEWKEYRGALGPGGAVFPEGTRLPPETSYCVGVDLGQVADFSAFCVLESRRLNPGDPGAPLYAHEVSHLERHRGRPYPEIARRVVELCAALPQPPTLAVDETGVGRSVCDDLRQAGPRTRWLVPITITSGMDATPQPDGSWHVAKRVLVGCTQINLQSGRLKAGKRLALAPVLIKEMLSFRAKVSASGTVTFGAPDTSDWRHGVHDDLVLSVALATWAAERGAARTLVF